MFNILGIFSKSYDPKSKEQKSFKYQKYPKDLLAKYQRWVDYEYKHKRFDKWKNETYLQVCEWASNSNLPDTMKKKCESLQVAFMAYRIERIGLKLPKDIKKSITKFYDGALPII